jgi:ABC transport system ATP-binding/permease protein
MSAGILRALMQLFAIIAGANKSSGREIVAVFLRQQLNKEMVNKYLQVYEDYAEKFHTSKNSEKKTSMASVKVLRICDQINDELQLKEKYFVIVRLLEFIREFNVQGDQEWQFIETVAEAFNIDKEVFEGLRLLTASDENDSIPDPNFLLATSDRSSHTNWSKHLQIDSLRGKLIFFRIDTESLFFVRYFGPDELFLNSQNKGQIFVAVKSVRSFIVMYCTNTSTTPPTTNSFTVQKM